MSGNPVNPSAGEGYKSGLGRRHKIGTAMRIIFQLSTIIGIVALTSLLYNIINGAFGFVAIQNTTNPDALVMAIEEDRMLNAPKLVASEDDDMLALGVASDPNAIGFFGYAFYQKNADTLKVLPIDGVEPSQQSVDSGTYSLARPLFIYSDAEIMAEKPAVADFVNFYLTHANEEIGDVGYFPISDEAMSTSMFTWLDAAGAGASGAESVVWPEVDPAATDGTILTAGSSTVAPLTERLGGRFKQEGFPGEVAVESIGSKAGIRRFCVEGDTDIANASRAMKRAEADVCVNEEREPLEFRVGSDAVAVVVSQQNEFVKELTTEQLRQIFTTAENWSDVNPAWPDEPIVRYIPSIDSGTLDFFVETVFNRELKDLPKETLMAALQGNVSKGLYRRFEADQPFEERTRDSVYELVLERVVEPQVVKTWSLVDSILHRDAIAAEAAAEFPDAEVQFVSWIKSNFITSPQSSEPEKAGVRTAILGSLWTMFITFIFAFPLGVGAAIYLEEYAADTKINRIIQTNINNLAGVPSIIYGMLGLAIWVRALEPLTSGSMFGVADPTTANGRTILAAGMTLGLLVLPLIIINSQEAIRAVPNSLRQASYGVGATQWQTIWTHVLPNAMPGILTGTILAISRAIGETAPLVVVGASTFITVDPTSPFSKFTTLPIQIYQWTSRPQGEFRNIAAAAILVLLTMLLALNATAVILRNRYSRRW